MEYPIAENVFDKMEYVMAHPQSYHDISDYILTVGDNLYPIISGEPLESEFDWMLGLFQKPNLSKLPIYAIRGNHDCKFDA